jgi:putative salt-induced outer membrane protein
LQKIILSALVASSLMVVAYADETPIISHAELGYVSTTGNTETQTFSLDASLKKDWDKHALNIKTDATYGEDTDVATKNKYSIEGSYDYKFTPSISCNYLAAYKRDKFTDYLYQGYTGPGVKYQAVKNEKHLLDLTASALYSFDKYRLNNESDDYTSYKLEAIYDFQIISNLKFHQDFSYRASFEDSDKYFINSKSAITAKISDILSAGLSYKVDYINIVEEDKEKSDNTLAFNLIFDY